jgi:ABC-type antimicrobial peptide transport system permease subunit
MAKGGKLLFIPPSDINENELESLGGSFNLPTVERIIKTDPNEGNYLEFGRIEFQHPIFVSLFEENEKPEFESPDIYKFIQFNETEEVKAIIRLIDDSIFLGEYGVNEGQVLFFNTAQLLSWSNFPIKGIFAPLVSRIVYYLSAQDEIRNIHFAGENIPVDISKTNFPIVQVTLPVGTDRISTSNIEQDILIYANTDKLGNYKFMADNKLIHHASVNSYPAESDLTKIELDLAEEIFSELFGKNYLILSSNENFSEKITQARFGTELWSYFLIIALLLALIEMFISRSTRKDILNADLK